MQEKIQKVQTIYLNKYGERVSSSVESERTRISVYINQEEDCHYIEFSTNASRYEVAGLLMALADKLTRNT